MGIFHQPKWFWGVALGSVNDHVENPTNPNPTSKSAFGIFWDLFGVWVWPYNPISHRPTWNPMMNRFSNPYLMVSGIRGYEGYGDLCLVEVVDSGGYGSLLPFKTL